ncbi:MBL fold metallo-hydrolase [Candidatus Parcubacteria bacterium]|nr:MBL fold metallo-hydrolase [Candidatus Parcubacteria bacterium]
MIVTYHGNEAFKFQLGDTVIAVNPISKDSKLKSARFGADVCLMSLNHPDFNGAEQVSFGEKKPFIVNGPGEYEIKGIFIKGFPSVSNYGGEERINTIYIFNFDNINICFLGALNSKDIPNEAKEAIEEVDLLFVPVGGNGVLDPHDAYKLAVQFEPKTIIPMGFDTGDKDSLKVFLKEGGEESLKPVDKLTIKKKDLEGKEGEIITLSAS